MEYEQTIPIKNILTITFGVTVCFNSMSGTLLEHVFLSRVHTYMQPMVKYLTYK